MKQQGIWGAVCRIWRQACHPGPRQPVQFGVDQGQEPGHRLPVARLRGRGASPTWLLSGGAAVSGNSAKGVAETQPDYRLSRWNG
jgi:hypothetical protein